MAIRRQDVEEEAKNLIANKTWKGHVILGVIILIIAGVVSSPIFTLVRAILELGLLAAGLSYIIWGIYQYVQAQEKRT